MLSFQMKNVGKIKTAEIQLDGITVVAGLNGTGKSTLAKCIFSALNSRKNIDTKIEADKQNEIAYLFDDWLETNLTPEYDDRAGIFEIAEEFAEDIMEAYAEKKQGAEKDETSQLIRELCDRYEIAIQGSDELSAHICEILNRSDREYVYFFVEQYYQEVFKNQINTLGTDTNACVQYDREEKNRTITSSVEFKNNDMVTAGKILMTQQENAIYIETRSILDSCGGSSISIRKNRQGAQLTVPGRELTEYLYVTKKKPTFSEKKRMEQSRAIVETMIADITHGALLKKHGMMEFIDRDRNQKIEFSNLSSGLKIFAVIQRLLENDSLKQGDVLLVDEPEVNLHPEWQVVLAEIMVRIYKELGIYIVVNSHSPYFIRALEVKLAEYECALNGRYYYLTEEPDGSVCSDVTDKTEVIYEALYRPLNDL